VSEFCSEKLRSLCCVRGLFGFVAIDVTIEVFAKVAIFALRLCVFVVVATEVAIEILCKSFDLCVVFVCVLLLLLRSNFRSRFCAKLVILCVVVVRACVSFVFDLTQKLQSLCCGRVLRGFFRMYSGRENAYEREESEGHHHQHHHHHEREESEERQHQPPYGREFEPRRGYAEEEVVAPAPYGYRPPVHEYGGGPYEEGERPAGFGDTTSIHHRKHDAQ